MKEFETFAELEASKQTEIGTRFVCRERAKAEYILQASGYVALAGDVTFANGRVGELQIVHSGMDLKVFGADWDGTISNAVERCKGVCKIFISDSYTTTGKSFSGLDGVEIKFLQGSLLFMEAGADKEILSFQNCTNIKVDNPTIDGNRLNQTVTGGNLARHGLFFNNCNGVRINGGQIWSVAGTGLRGRNSSNFIADGTIVWENGSRHIYVAAADTGGSTTENVTIRNCVIDNRNTNDEEVKAQNGIMLTHDASQIFNNVKCLNNSVLLHPDNLLDTTCYTIAGGSNMVISGNNSTNGDLGISSFKGKGVTISNNTCFGGGQMAIEVAHQSQNVTVTGNVINGNNTLEAGVEINGVIGSTDNVVISGNTIINTQQLVNSSQQPFGDPHKKITLSGNNGTSGLGGEIAVYIRDCEEFTSKGNTWDNIDKAGAFMRLDSVKNFCISDRFKGVAHYAIELFSSAAFTIESGNIAGCNFDETNFLPLTNYIKNNMFAGSTIGPVVVNGNTRAPEFLDYSNNILKWSGNGTPEGVVSAGVGSIYIRKDGGAGTTYYVKESGTGNTGWVGK